MPRTPLPVAGSNRTGATGPQLVPADPVNGNSVANSDGQTLLIVANTGAVTRTLTIQLTAVVDGQPATARTVPVPAGQQLLLGGYPYWWYGMTLQLDPEHTDLQLAALRFGDPLPLVAQVVTATFTLSGNAVIADLTAAGLTATGNVLIVDAGITSSTIDGNVLVVTI